mmetsp:Transcript_9328/g.26240  ORF Transcript_9328/g.26240 Transcript_9328/m.26240 type:complete len:204 (-) Transcript_9328:1060-1671(-)
MDPAMLSLGVDPDVDKVTLANAHLGGVLGHPSTLYPLDMLAWWRCSARRSHCAVRSTCDNFGTCFSFSLGNYALWHGLPFGHDCGLLLWSLLCAFTQRRCLGARWGDRLSCMRFRTGWYRLLGNRWLLHGHLRRLLSWCRLRCGANRWPLRSLDPLFGRSGLCRNNHRWIRGWPYCWRFQGTWIGTRTGQRLRCTRSTLCFRR